MGQPRCMVSSKVCKFGCVREVTTNPYSDCMREVTTNPHIVCVCEVTTKPHIVCVREVNTKPHQIVNGSRDALTPYGMRERHKLLVHVQAAAQIKCALMSTFT
jgi:hypothetical protein